MKYPPSSLIACDVDGTLHNNGRLNEAVVSFLREQKAAGMRLMLWSAAGRQHALDAVERFGLQGLFDTVESKPGYVVDDLGWTWVKYTKIVSSDDIADAHEMAAT